MKLLEALHWRYATKKMNGKKVPQEKINQIIEAAYLAPTSSGLQPFQIYAISNQSLKEKMLPIAYNQQQIVDSSHVLVFASWDNYTKQRIDDIYEHMAIERGQDLESVTDYKNNLIKNLTSREEHVNAQHAAHQAYIAFGIAIAAAAELAVDATPMEGFDPKAMDELLGLPEKGLNSVLVLALGYRDEANDWLVNLKKVRQPKEQFLTILD